MVALNILIIFEDLDLRHALLWICWLYCKAQKQHLISGKGGSKPNWIEQSLVKSLLSHFRGKRIEAITAIGMQLLKWLSQGDFLQITGVEPLAAACEAAALDVSLEVLNSDVVFVGGNFNMAQGVSECIRIYQACQESIERTILLWCVSYDWLRCIYVLLFDDCQTGYCGGDHQGALGGFHRLGQGLFAYTKLGEHQKITSGISRLSGVPFFSGFPTIS